MTADVVGWCLFGLLAWQLDEIAMHPVVADLEIGQAGTGFFTGFQIDQELTGIFTERLQLIQLGVIPGF